MRLLKDLSETSPSHPELVLGYSEEELCKLERLYDIRLHGDFRLFMSQMGRCDGGLIGDDPIVLYRDMWSVRSQILFQMVFFSDIQDLGLFQYLNKPFVFSLESETQYFFLQTAHDDELVYHYDENHGVVRCTDVSFMHYMKDVCVRYETNRAVCKGELLNV